MAIVCGSLITVVSTIEANMISLKTCGTMNIVQFATSKFWMTTLIGLMRDAFVFSATSVAIII